MKIKKRLGIIIVFCLIILVHLVSNDLVKFIKNKFNYFSNDDISCYRIPAIAESNFPIFDSASVRRILVEEYMKYTPIEKWFASGILQSSRWPNSHMSDILRYLTLWKFGGIYLDLDVVVTTSLVNLTNFAGAEDWMDVAAGVISFSENGLGRRIANGCLRDLMRNFRGDLWGNNGPGVITRTLQKFCSVKYAKDMTSKRCNGFKVFPPSVFYPIFYKDWRRYFQTEDFNATMKLINSARAIHLWNKLSFAEKVYHNSKVPYAIIAEKYCPHTFNECTPVF
ncbi:lactosylceramide 4-alpha-galactosyltransferase-like isoform X2 [Trichogramma pretiosum]|uniref:lactosylceramide 4-alpha-galactosyltransferase-like isoform X2 n=1 Tax=Trichogramma pretiosum TaxID=7493 RepID=UPI0006C9791A|nr:lactosylceramide 4-alpha-galactosyltransferase-like isoform X2 [Trichogramma pretiosum]